MIINAIAKKKSADPIFKNNKKEIERLPDYQYSDQVFGLPKISVPLKTGKKLHHISSDPDRKKKSSSSKLHISKKNTRELYLSPYNEDLNMVSSSGQKVI